MELSRFRPLNVDESITWSRNGVLNFRVEGYVCHRMGSLLSPPNRRPMYAQVYIDDPDIQARVASRMDMTDGFDKDILETIDQVMTTHNPHSQQFMNARRLLIESAGPEYQAAVEEFARCNRAGEARPEDNPDLRLHEFLPGDENL
ncbi:Helitron helicase [Phytophthora megakarya]|uniref:Helitron helicase n=1 Tax=Phytophthora megakarya TaxID=4795 RepID=A0A225WPF2_9STRA|nr:Helitron helicase [Phytophthora megakarya]